MPRFGIDPRAETEPIDPASLFSRAHEECWLEIGFGTGEHLAGQAARHPDIGMIGAEPYVNGVAGLCRRIEERGLANIRIFHEDTRLLLPRLPTASIDRCFVLFSDPWPKRRHWRRRVLNPETLSALARVMRPGAELIAATDDPGLAGWTVEQILRHPDFLWTARTPDDWRRRLVDQPVSRYEEKALAAGRQPFWLRIVRRTDRDQG